MSKFKLSSGRKQRPDFIALFGVDGVGKTSFGAGAPKPGIVDIERGSAFLNVSRIDEGLETYDDVYEATRFMYQNPEIQSIIIDSADRLESLIWAKVCKDHGVQSIEDIGYGKGYIFALKIWEGFISLLKEIREHKNVIVVAHDMVKTFKDPTMIENYDRHEIKLHKHASSLLREEVDMVGFATYEVFVQKENVKDVKGKAIGEGKRVLRTERRPGHEGKNRLGLPYEIALDWASYEAAKKIANANDPKVIKRQIEGLIPDIADESTRVKVQAAMENENNPEKLKQFLNKVNIIIGDEKGES